MVTMVNFVIIKIFKERKNSEASWSGGDRTGCAGGGRRVPWSIRQDWASCHPVKAIRWRRRRRSIKRVVGWLQCHRTSEQRPRGNGESCGDQREAMARAKALRPMWLELGEWVRTAAGGEGGESVRQRMQSLWVMRTTWAFTLRKVGVTDGSEQRRDMDWLRNSEAPSGSYGAWERHRWWGKGWTGTLTGQDMGAQPEWGCEDGEKQVDFWVDAEAEANTIC